MNTNLLNIVKQIVAAQGDGILSDPRRLQSVFSDLAKNEPKEERVAFGRCIEIGAYQELSKTRSAPYDRRNVKTNLAKQLQAKSGLDIRYCIDAVDLLEEVMFPSSPASTPSAPKIGNAKPISIRTIIFGVAGALGAAAGEFVSEGVGTGNAETFFQVVFNVAIWAAFISLGIAVGLLAAQSIYLKKKPVLKSLVKTALIGIALGAAAGGIAQVLFAFTNQISTMAEIISRIFCWGIMGWGVGWGVSLFVPNFPKKRAMMAGFLGGFAGGAIFRAMFILPGVLGRVIGVMSLGFFIGLTISIIEEALREAWLTIIYGKNETKTVSLGEKPIIFGSSSQADIFLKDAPVKAAVQIENAKIVMYDKTTGQRRELRNGERVDLGSLSFIANSKK